MTQDATETPAEPELSDEQRLYEDIFGEQSEWHRPAAAAETGEDDDNAVYARLFGATTERTQP